MIFFFTVIIIKEMLKIYDVIYKALKKDINNN